MYTNPPSGHGNIVDKDQDVDNKVDDMSVTAKGRFIVPTSTLLRIHSMDSARVSPFPLDSTTDNPSGVAALACSHFHFESTNFEVCDDDDTWSTGVCKEDGEEVMQPSQHDLPTFSIPSVSFKVSSFTYDCS